MVAPQVPIGVGIAGWGGIARIHTLALRALPVLFADLPFDLSLAAVQSRNPERKQEAIRQAGFAAAVERDDELLRLADAVDICTPNALHARLAVAAWRAGKPVYCEKPLAESLEAATAMLDAWRSLPAPPPSQVALVLRFWPAMARAKDWIAAGHVGRILSFRARMVHGGYLDTARLMSWRLDKALAGGGALADLGIHLIDAVQFLLGPITDASARMRTFVTERPVNPGGRAAPVTVDDWAEVTCTLPSGAVGTIEATRAGDGQEETVLELFGTEGSLRISGDAPYWPRWYDRRRGELVVRGGEPAPGPYTQAVLSVCPPARLSMGPMVDAHLGSLHWWLRRIAQPGWEQQMPPVAADLADGAAAQAILHRAYEAAQQ
ncbi:MAG TPA: Gfo/Idh/MocA family oxidoreductase [Symbiobacteriaceae bacterium]|nr:Gfo/Idh/MocA family oxidoreductase [Symbiobacteriaceae bacterium]